MSHQFIDGKIIHNRFGPKKHNFVYNFFMVDIDLQSFSTLQKPSLFSINSFNLFSFYTQDHFGKSEDFLENVDQLLSQFSISKENITLRFLTLPRISGFVFNPISVVLILKDNIPTQMLAEVHNYNGGRVVYNVPLVEKNGKYHGTSNKDMYVSPFFDRIGDYEFNIVYTQEKFLLEVILFENSLKVLTTKLIGTSKEFSNNSIKRLFLKHTFLTLWVVTRTLWQSLKLKLKGLQWNSPLAIDQTRRY